jgi:hypothetical protein
MIQIISSCFTDFLAASVPMFIQVCFTCGTTTNSTYFKNSVLSLSAYCKIWYYLQESTGMTYLWMLSAACLDRCALSSTDARLRRFASVYVARRVVAVIVFIWIVFSVPLLFLYDLRAGNCIIVYGFAASLSNAIFTIINTYAIPVSIMVTCSLLIRRNLAKKRERRQFIIVQQQRINNREYLQRKRDQQALVMLFAQIFVYITLATPWAIFNIYNAISLNVPNKSADRLAIERFLINLVGTLIILFPTASFYLYTLTSSIFRKELLIMLRSIPCLKCSVNTRRIQPTLNDAPQELLPIQ